MFSTLEDMEQVDYNFGFLSVSHGVSITKFPDTDYLRN